MSAIPDDYLRRCQQHARDVQGALTPPESEVDHWRKCAHEAEAMSVRRLENLMEAERQLAVRDAELAWVLADKVGQATELSEARTALAQAEEQIQALRDAENAW